MSEKILYYFGAGASALALPLARTVWGDLSVSGTGPLIEGLIYGLENLQYEETISRTLEEEGCKEELSEILSNCVRLSKNANEFGDIDTYAKYLKIIGQHQKLAELKVTLSQYFTIKQLLLRAKDSRYIPWLIGIMNKKKFPETIKVLSWNYDFQLQLAGEFLEIYGEDVSHNGSGFTYSPPMLNYYPNLDPTFRDFEMLSLIHLNGIAGYGEEGEMKTVGAFQNKYRDNIKEMLQMLTNKNNKMNLHFAWEKNGYHDRLMEHVKQMIEGTTVMVVVGYSFPFYNREVDKQVIQLLCASPLFKKIYFQDPKLTGKHLINQFNLPDRIVIEHIPNVDNFYIPFEY